MVPADQLDMPFTVPSLNSSSEMELAMWGRRGDGMSGCVAECTCSSQHLPWCLVMVVGVDGTAVEIVQTRLQGRASVFSGCGSFRLVVTGRTAIRPGRCECELECPRRCSPEAVPQVTATVHASG